MPDNHFNHSKTSAEDLLKHFQQKFQTISSKEFSIEKTPEKLSPAIPDQNDDATDKIKQNFSGLQQEFQRSIAKLSQLFLSHYQQYQDIKIELAKARFDVEQVYKIKATAENLTLLIKRSQEKKQELELHYQYQQDHFNKEIEKKKKEWEEEFSILKKRSEDERQKTKEDIEVLKLNWENQRKAFEKEIEGKKAVLEAERQALYFRNQQALKEFEEEIANKKILWESEQEHYFQKNKEKLDLLEQDILLKKEKWELEVRIKEEELKEKLSTLEKEYHLKKEKCDLELKLKEDSTKEKILVLEKEYAVKKEKLELDFSNQHQLIEEKKMIDQLNWNTKKSEIENWQLQIKQTEDSLLYLYLGQILAEETQSLQDDSQSLKHRLMEKERTIYTLEQENKLLMKKLEQHHAPTDLVPDIEAKYAQAFSLFKKKQAEEMLQYKRTIHHLEQKIKEKEEILNQIKSKSSPIKNPSSPNLDFEFSSPKILRSLNQK